MADKKPASKALVKSSPSGGKQLELSERKLKEFSERFVSTTRQVLLEHSKPGKPMSGFTDNYLKVSVKGDSSLDNTMVSVRLDEVINNGEEVKGEIVL